MKKHSLGMQILSVFLALVLVIGACPFRTSAAETTAEGGEDRGTRLPFTRADDADADVLHEAARAQQTKAEAPYADTDVVRVSIVLNRKATLEVFSASDVVSNAAAMAYRDQLQVEQNAVVARIEQEVLAGAHLDVVWNMTLAANIVSANVPYGQMEEIAAVRGVKNVFVENQYDPLEDPSDSAQPMMSTSSSMIGSSVAWAAGYTGTFTCTASENSGATKDAVRVREPLVIPGLTGNLLVSVAPGFTVTGICCTDSPALSIITPETGSSTTEDTVTAAS